MAKAQREERPVAAEIKRAAEQTGVAQQETTMVSFHREDVEYMVNTLRSACDDVLDAEIGDQSECTLSALRAVRSVQLMLSPRIGGAS